MKRYKLLYLFWLLPLAFLFLIGQQATVYYGINDTFENGNSYTAEVVDFKFKQIAAQTNGYVVLKFDTNDGETIQRKLSLPVEMAGALQQIRVVPVRYNPGGWQEIVILPTIETQKSLVWSNALMAGVAFIITLIIALVAHRFVNQKLAEGDEEIVIERVDT